MHETDALCLGERAFGQARGMDDFALVDATGGLGAAVMSGGQVLAGHSGLAGEIGHITVDPQGRRCGCGNIGRLETVASDLALAGLISAKIGKTLSFAGAFELVRSGQATGRRRDRPHDPVPGDWHRGPGQYLQSGGGARQARMFDLREGLFEQCWGCPSPRVEPVLADCKIMRASCGKLQMQLRERYIHYTSTSGFEGAR